MVTICGNSGIGKSAIIKEIAHFLHDRDFQSDGTLFFNLEEISLIE
jgi:ABC-type phosphate/phosphonate transport system ATPase subunit